MCQNIHSELLWQKHEIYIELADNDERIKERVFSLDPEIVICPMLRTRIPEEVWRAYVCIIVHPGIKGDRGPSSLDWAIVEGQKEWGTTLMQATEKFDGGNIWSSNTFEMRPGSKSSIYRDEVVRCGVKCVLEIIERFKNGYFKPQPLEEVKNAKGSWHSYMKQDVRQIDWSSDTTANILKKMNASDSVPGILDTINGKSYYLYGAHEENSLFGKVPGEIIAKRTGAICRATVDSSIWISHLKEKQDDPHATFKLPATLVLGDSIQEVPEISVDLIHDHNSKTFKDIWYEEDDEIGYLYFEFYNGAMSTEQCLRLKEAFLGIRRRKTKAIVLMGGRDFWSNGIHLNVIEAAEDPAKESWRNINAIDDLVHAILTTDSHITISAMQGSAGAGGVMLGIASDLVYMRPGLVLNPHYKSMGLYGSEYWTYLLPKRVGEQKAVELTESCMPICIKEAESIGLVDGILSHEETDTFREKVGRIAKSMVLSADFEQILENKNLSREKDEASKSLAEYRASELEIMKQNFSSDEYHRLRKQFVRKIISTETPIAFKQTPNIPTTLRRSLEKDFGLGPTNIEQITSNN